MNESIDRFALQRLLDGRLSENERALFFELVDENPEHWRTIALAFVEEQLLRSELRGTVSSLPVAEQRGRFRWTFFLAQTAAILLVLGVGTWLGWEWRSSTDELTGYVMVVEPQPTGHSQVALEQQPLSA